MLDDRTITTVLKSSVDYPLTVFYRLTKQHFINLTIFIFGVVDRPSLTFRNTITDRESSNITDNNLKLLNITDREKIIKNYIAGYKQFDIDKMVYPI